MQSIHPQTAPATRSFTVLRAAHLGMCFGVRDALALALDHSRQGPLTILGQLVHNESVLNDLQSRGIASQDHPADVKTPTVMISAHGASHATLQRARDHGLEVLEATCPLVHFAHRAVRQLAQDAYHPVIIGQRGHVEVRGLTEDLPQYDVVLTEEDVTRLEGRKRFGVAAQTTQPLEKVRRLVECLRRCFPFSEVRFIDTVCQPTKQRQTAAEALARQSDVVIVIGGARSNNTTELAATCRRYCPQVHHVQGPEDLRPEWFSSARTVGITAGTSTPDPIIEAVESWLLSASSS